MLQVDLSGVLPRASLGSRPTGSPYPLTTRQRKISYDGLGLLPQLLPGPAVACPGQSTCLLSTNAFDATATHRLGLYDPVGDQFRRGLRIEVLLPYQSMST